MEMFLKEKSKEIAISTARFANVAFSDGSLLFGFKQRIAKNQPIAAPTDIKRFFVTPKEAGQLCLMSTILGNNNEIFFPKLSNELNLVTFSSIAEKFLQSLNLRPIICETEEQARELAFIGHEEGTWPCFFSSTDTSGEKSYEEFFSKSEKVDFERFATLGIVTNSCSKSSEELNLFLQKIRFIEQRELWDKDEFIRLFNEMIPNFGHLETGKNLDNKM